jgi:short subunit dehydrogenase-like uncharacterized protein
MSSSSTNNNNNDTPNFALGRPQEAHSGLTLLGIQATKAAMMTATIPFGLAYQIYALITNPHVPFKKSPPQYPPVGPLLVNTPPKFEDREFDVVVYGATGFAGELTVQYLAENYKDKVSWAIAGRRKDALEKIKSKYPGASHVQCIVADANDDKSLQTMCSRTRVILTTVGPFQLYGTSLVRAAIATSTSYCDITGETDWVAGLVDHYDEKARNAGSAIVSCCGHDSIPWDLSTMMCAERLKRLTGEELATVVMVDECNSAPSGGTLRTVEESIPPMPYRSATHKFSPLLLTPDGKESKYRTKDKSSVLVGKDSRGFVGPFPMSMVNAQVVRRSNALNGYGTNVQYRESRLGPGFTTVLARYLELFQLLPALLLPDSIKYKLIPAPGSGPSVESMENGFLQVTAMATGVQGSKVTSRIYFNQDAGYKQTALMLCESGLTIALSRDKLKLKSGVLTPGSCQGSVLMDRLIQAGVKWAWLSETSKL